MNPNEKIVWSAPEYEEKGHNVDWFWALGVIVVAGATTSVIFGNYFFAILLVVAGVLMGVFAAKKPQIIEYELGNKGFRIMDHFYPYEDIKSFWVEKNENPMLFFKSKRLIMPIISVPIEPTQANDIRNTFISKDIPEEETKEHPSIKIMDRLGF